ncbi:MAG: hypothetical protein H6734_07765 [Alphaproteobacteria bacterium]|nr:hypothetical protein [Alphaproteobacteria bacterium]
MYRLVPPALLVAVLAASAWAEHPPGEVIGSVVAVDVTQAGLDAFLPIIDDYVPAGYELAEVASATTFPASNDCAFFDACYEYDVSNLSAEFELVNPTITPGNGVINVATTINLSAVNSQSTPARQCQCARPGLPTSLFADDLAIVRWTTRRHPGLRHVDPGRLQHVHRQRHRQHPADPVRHLGAEQQQQQDPGHQ